ncbi:DciA family protein [Kitasatospora cineracea]|uniref:DciA family protein n=1 Tax=Kitasatospora cineracea TaxID=88074 RepID=UPI0036DEBBED
MVLLRAMKARARRVPDRSSGGSGLPGLVKRPWGSDPMPISALVEELSGKTGWPLSQFAAVGGRWSAIVGPDIAAHITPTRFDPDAEVLHLAADSTAWATQCNLLAPQLLARLRHELGDGAPRSLKIASPPSPARIGRLKPHHHVGPQRVVPAHDPTPPPEDDWEPSHDDFPLEAVPQGSVRRPAPVRTPTGPAGPDEETSDLRERLLALLNARNEAAVLERREREERLRLPRGWLDGPENLNPRPAPDPARHRQVQKVLAAARARAKAERTTIAAV